MYLLLASLSVVMLPYVLLELGTKFNFKYVLKFLGLMTFVTILRLLIHRGTQSDIQFSYELFLVGWEDILFCGLPLILQTYYGKSKTIMLWLASSLFFGYGHMYQGWAVALLTTLYPFYISRPITEKHGILTAMVIHTLYDIITVLTVVYLSKGTL